eukprot:TRINITY_DN78_c7_g1_i1.p1 TRINITY_DN78_c7_g1~~TRINITY_DN78_c7_g1_i1.p1  ORF type:complete len:576 (+),score=248.43 TRINITY_DN78_c7_g1_i1:14-1741(+)
MRTSSLIIIVALCVLLLVQNVQSETVYKKGDVSIPKNILTNSWVVRLDEKIDAKEIADRHGMRHIKRLNIHHNYKGHHYYLLEEGSNLKEKFPHISNSTEVHWFQQQVTKMRRKRDVDPGILNPDDPYYLQGGWWEDGSSEVALDISSVWEKYTGTGITISVVDDGLSWKDNPEFIKYKESCSYDVNFDDPDPTPYSFDAHGTASAGVAAAAGNNNHCGIGVAPNAYICGVRVLAKMTVTDYEEAEAITYARDEVDVYSNSWGPYDDGETLEGPGPLVLDAIEDSINKGRNGKGNIFAWAGGNGYENGDSCSYDGYASSRFTIAVGAVGGTGLHAYYSEGCPALIGVVASSDKYSNSIKTAGINGGCYAHFGGTSAASPQIAGLAALAIEANPDLTWRDVQGVFINAAIGKGSNVANWEDVADGKTFNTLLGFGHLTAPKIIEQAENWVLLPDYIELNLPTSIVNQPIQDNKPSTYVSDVISVSENIIIEHVEVYFSATHNRRGDLMVELISPSGISSSFAHVHSDSGHDYDNWLFTSFKHWGEESLGDWTLRVSDGKRYNSGTFDRWTLNLYGH